MTRTLVAREWRAIRGPVGLSVAGLAYMGFLTRYIDNVEMVGLYSCLVAIVLGVCAGGMVQRRDVREFLFTLPVRRVRLVGAKVLLSLVVLNALTGLATATVLCDLPLHLYRLLSESAFGNRAIPVDFPIFYPLVFFYSSAVSPGASASPLRVGRRSPSSRRDPTRLWRRAY